MLIHGCVTSRTEQNGEGFDKYGSSKSGLVYTLSAKECQKDTPKQHSRRISSVPRDHLLLFYRMPRLGNNWHDACSLIPLFPASWVVLVAYWPHFPLHET